MALVLEREEHESLFLEPLAVRSPAPDCRGDAITRAPRGTIKLPESLKATAESFYRAVFQKSQLTAKKQLDILEDNTLRIDAELH